MEDKVLGFGGVGGVFPVDVEAVEAPVLDELDGGGGKFGAAGRGGGDGGEFGRVGPAADGEEDFHGAVLFFEEEELLDAAVGVVALVVPGVGWVVFLEVCVGV